MVGSRFWCSREGDALRTRVELLAETALLRQQLLVLRRQVRRPRVTAADRWWMVMAARVATAWREALLLVQPATVLRCHRELYRRWWRRKTRARSPASPSIPDDTVALIREMANANRLWGAERIRGELLKLGLRVSKRTVQKYMRGARPRSPSGRAGERSCANTRKSFGPATFCSIARVGRAGRMAPDEESATGTC